MSWRIIRWALLGTSLYLLFLSVTLPAPYLVSWIDHRFPSIRLDAPDGSALSGHAAQLSVDSTALGALAWHPDWLAPLSATVGYRWELTSPDTDLRGRTDLRAATLFLRDLHGSLAISVLDKWLPLPAHSVDGQVELDLKQIRVREGRFQDGEGTIRVKGLLLSWPERLSLGSYALALTPTGGKGLQGKLSDDGGPLQLQASLSLTPDGAYHVSGTVSARADADTALKQFLTNLGTPDPAGRYALDFEGHL